MPRMIVVGAALLSLAIASSTASADPVLILSTTADLDNLQVGQDVQFDVLVEGIEVEQNFIFVLNSEIRYTAELLEPVSGPTPGEILDNPIKQSNFLAQSSMADGVVDGRFSESPDPTSGAIGLNGVYYSFTLRAEAVGSGTIGFFFDPNDLAGTTSYAATSTGFALAPIEFSGPLSFTVVPEPSSLALLGLGLGAAGLALGRARRRKLSRDPAPAR